MEMTVVSRPSKWRAPATLALIAILVVAEIMLGAAVYFAPWDVDLAVTIACGGVAAFAVIDRWPRPHGETDDARSLRWFLPAWSLVPFLCALASSAWVHYQQWGNGLRDIEEIAAKLEHQTLDTVIAARFPREPADPREKLRFTQLALVVQHDLERAARKIDQLQHGKRSGQAGECTPALQNADRAGYVRCRARRDTQLGFILTLGAQALFVMWIPGLLMISMARAHRGLQKLEVRHDRCAVSARNPVSLHECLELRDLRILAEDHSYFIPRLCFGTLLVLGTTYMFAPFGLKESYIMSLANEHALPGQTSFVLWCNHFAEVPVLVVGFVGFLIYALITATQRFAQDDLDDLAIMSLLVRGLVVILLSFALSASPVNDEAARLFVFIAGVFPVRALEAIAKRANVSIDPDFASDGPSSFEGVPNLDPAKVFALRAAGIQSSYDLAAMRIEDVARRVRIDPRLLGRAVDRAILIDAVGRKLTEDLACFAITSATELVDARPLPQAIIDKLGDAPQRVAERLALDGRVTQVRQWLFDAQRTALADRSVDQLGPLGPPPAARTA